MVPLLPRSGARLGGGPHDPHPHPPPLRRVRVIAHRAGGHPITLQGVRVAGTGSHLPANVVTNADFARKLDTTDEWIRSRTGIRERRFAAPDVASSHMGTAAARGVRFHASGKRVS